jgi:hypothetical protein
MEGFLAGAGSVPGYDHTKPGQPGWTNNHDATLALSTDEYAIGFVCDGCGSTPHPEVGAHMGVAQAVKIASSLLAEGFPLVPVTVSAFIRFFQEQLVTSISLTARSMNAIDDFDKVVEDFFLFTVLGVIMTNEYTLVIGGMADGVWAINGEAHVIPPFPGNAPAYIGNHVRTHRGDRPRADFTQLAMLPTKGRNFSSARFRWSR